MLSCIRCGKQFQDGETTLFAEIDSKGKPKRCTSCGGDLRAPSCEAPAPPAPEGPDLRRRDLRTLEEARQYLHDNIREGLNCPCCGQIARVYRRKLNRIMAQSLVAFYRHATRKAGPKRREVWFHALEVLTQEAPEVRGSGDYAKLRYWGLIETGPAGGVFCLTRLGVEFVQGRCRVPRYVHVFNDNVVQVKDDDPEPPIDVREALGEGFDLKELMDEIAPELVGAPERLPVHPLSSAPEIV